MQGVDMKLTFKCHIDECLHDIRVYDCNTVKYAKKLANVLVNNGFDSVVVFNENAHHLFSVEW